MEQLMDWNCHNHTTVLTLSTETAETKHFAFTLLFPNSTPAAWTGSHRQSKPEFQS
jgi:hypothetical protein